MRHSVGEFVAAAASKISRTVKESLAVRLRRVAAILCSTSTSLSWCLVDKLTMSRVELSSQGSSAAQREGDLDRDSMTRIHLLT